MQYVFTGKHSTIESGHTLLLATAPKMFEYLCQNENRFDNILQSFWFCGFVSSFTRMAFSSHSLVSLAFRCTTRFEHRSAITICSPGHVHHVIFSKKSLTITDDSNMSPFQHTLSLCLIYVSFTNGHNPKFTKRIPNKMQMKIQFCIDYFDLNSYNNIAHVITIVLKIVNSNYSYLRLICLFCPHTRSHFNFGSCIRLAVD